MNTNKNIISAVVLIIVLAIGVTLYNLNKKPATNSSNDNTPAASTSTGVKVISASGSPVGSVKSDTLGNYLTDAKGMTLYAFGDKKNSCTGDCLKTWVPFAYDNQNWRALTDTLSKRLNLVTQKDGSYQYAYGEKALYYYVGDQKPGDTKGQGYNNLWFIISVE